MQLAAQSDAGEPKLLRRPALVPAMPYQGLLEDASFQDLDAVPERTVHVGQGIDIRLTHGRHGAQHARGKQLGAEPIALAKRQHAPDLVMQLAHVAGPVVGAYALQRLVGKAAHALAEGALDVV